MLKELCQLPALGAKARSPLAFSAAGGVAGICLGMAIGIGLFNFSGSRLHHSVSAEARIESHGSVRGPGPAIDAAGAAALMKSTIIAIQQANQTGNYSVLRDLGTPAFRESFDQARLTRIFARLRALRTDLSGLVLSMPASLSGAPGFAANKLRLSGGFDSQSLHIRYNLAFVWISDRWRIEGLGIDTSAVTERSGESASSPNTRVLEPA